MSQWLAQIAVMEPMARTAPSARSRGWGLSTSSDSGAISSLQRARAAASRRNDARGASSANDLVAGKELADFLDRGLGGIRTVYRILADRFGIDLADRAGRRLRRIGRPHQIAIPGDGVFAF